MDDLKRWVTEQLDMSPDADDVLAAAEKRTASAITRPRRCLRSASSSSAMPRLIRR